MSTYLKVRLVSTNNYLLFVHSLAMHDPLQCPASKRSDRQNAFSLVKLKISLELECANWKTQIISRAALVTNNLLLML